MCGWTSGLTLLDLTEGNKNFEFKLIDYCNSGDSPYGGKNEVVGYNAIAVIEKEECSINCDEKSFSFTIMKRNNCSLLLRKHSEAQSSYDK